jgi:hypothetical protein
MAALLAEHFVVLPRGTDMTMLQDHTGEPISRRELNSATPLRLLSPDEPRAPTAVLSPAKRAALIACLNGGIVDKRCGVWIAPSTSTSDKPISGVTVADLGRDGMLTLSMLHGSASARLTTRGNWFARTVVTEMAERAAVAEGATLTLDVTLNPSQIACPNKLGEVNG